MGTFIVGGGLLLIVACVARSMWKRRKCGKPPCGCDCGHCGGCR